MVSSKAVGLYKLFLLIEEIEQDQADEHGDVVPAEAAECFEVVMANNAYELLDASEIREVA